MVQVPVQDRGQAQLPEVVQLDAQRPAGQAQVVRHLDEALERHPAQGHRVAPPQRVQVDAVAVEGGDHGQAGEAALGGLGLPDQGQAVAAAEVQEPPLTAAMRAPAPSSGLRSQSISARLSRTMSARRSMSGRRGTRPPWASTSGRSSAAVTR